MPQYASPRPLIMSPSPSAAATNMQGAVEVLSDQRFGRFGIEVAEKYGQGIAAGSGDFGHSLLHVLLILDGDLALVEIGALGGAGGSNRRAPLLAQRDGKAVTADGDNAQLDFGDI